jgi:hypothetical protein
MDAMDAIVEKIKKAMRLAQKAGTEGERVAAENAAKRLASANGIALESITVEDNEAKSAMVEGEDWYRLSGCEVGHAVNLIRRHFAVVMMLRQHGRRVKFTYFGCRLNIEIAKYVYEIVIRESRSAWNRTRKAHATKQLVVRAQYGVEMDDLKKGAFMRGFFFALHEKLEKNPIRNDLEQYEAERKSAERKFEEFKSRGGVEETKMRRSPQDYSAANAGYAAGKGVSLNRPCDSHGYGGRAAQISQQFQLGMK